MADTDRVVVLAKPGDLLLVGNCAKVAGMSVDELKMVTGLFEKLGIMACFFVDDIDIAKLPANA